MFCTHCCYWLLYWFYCVLENKDLRLNIEIYTMIISESKSWNSRVAAFVLEGLYFEIEVKILLRAKTEDGAPTTSFQTEIGSRDFYADFMGGLGSVGSPIYICGSWPHYSIIHMQRDTFTCCCDGLFVAMQNDTFAYCHDGLSRSKLNSSQLFKTSGWDMTTWSIYRLVVLVTKFSRMARLNVNMHTTWKYWSHSVMRLPTDTLKPAEGKGLFYIVSALTNTYKYYRFQSLSKRYLKP